MTVYDAGWAHRFLVYWRSGESGRRERSLESASWCAPCPHCGSEADWLSEMTDEGLRNQLDCPQCGDCEWFPAAPR